MRKCRKSWIYFCLSNFAVFLRSGKLVAHTFYTLQMYPIVFQTCSIHFILIFLFYYLNCCGSESESGSESERIRAFLDESESEIFVPDSDSDLDPDPVPDPVI